MDLRHHPYLIFESAGLSPSGKTKIVRVMSRSSGEILARIKWYGPWRQYCFYPLLGTIWNQGCLEAVNAMISVLMVERVASSKDSN